MSNEFFDAMRSLRALLEKPLPGGRGFQHAHYRSIQLAAERLAKAKLPEVQHG